MCPCCYQEMTKTENLRVDFPTPEWSPTPFPRNIYPEPIKSSGQDIYEVKLFLPKDELLVMKEHSQKTLSCCITKKKHLWQLQVIDAYERFQLKSISDSKRSSSNIY